MARPLRLDFDPIERAGAIWERRWGPGEPMRVATSVFRAQQLLLARFDAILKPYQLTFARYEALVLLHFSRRGELPLSVVGQRLMVHPTSVTNIIDRLVGQGYVDRRPNPEDRRGVLAAITPTGREVAENATRDLMAVEFGLEALDPDDRRCLWESLRKLRVDAEDFLVDPD